MRSLVALALAGVLPAGATLAQAPLVLQDATPIRLRLSETLSSETARVGDTVSFEVLEDIDVGGLLVIKQGSPAVATITEAQAKRRMGRGGKLDVNIDYVRMVTGDKVALRAVRENSGGSKTGAMTAGIVATSIVFFPAAPFFLFMKGKEVTIPKGTEITSYVHSDVRLDEAKLRAAAVNAGSAAPVAASAPAPAQPAVQTGAPAAPPQQAAPALAATPAAPRGGLSNADIIELKKVGFSDDLIVTKINGSACSFKLDTSDMIELKKAGLSDRVIGAMMAKMK
ncbi:MAG TPA: hypothetical protein PKJ41_04165 [Bryobacteraceae bacterium]|nr:hypothetical protein [Bryobacteraceae bacterium]HPT26931.1 hypothetical protein [Bryobacteraceae bacterium]